MAAEESLSRLDSQVSMDASPPEINLVVQESDQTSVAGGKDVHAEIDAEESKSSFDRGTRIDFFDVLILYSEDNKSEARTFCDHLKNDIKLKDNEPVKAVLYDECVPLAGSKFNLLTTATKRCTFIFCYITKEFCEDKWTELMKDECLMEAIENEEKQWCLVPVLTVPTKTAKFKLPAGLRSLKGINYYENNKYYRDSVSALIQHNLYRRLDKERKQKFTENKENKETLHFGNEEICCQENKEKLGTKQQEKEKTTEQGVNDGLIRSQPVFIQKAGDQTGIDPYTQPIGTSFERRSEENDSTCINSIKSTDQLSKEGSLPLLDGPNSVMVSSSINSCTEDKVPIQEESCTGATSDQLYQGGSSNLMQPAVHNFGGNGIQSDRPLLDGPDSALRSKSINSYTGEEMHIQKECSDRARFTECLQDIGVLSLYPDVDGMHSESDDQPQDTQITPVNQSPSCWGTEVTAEEEEDHSLETKSKDGSMSVKKTKEKKEQHLETKSKDHSMLETKSNHSMPVKKTNEKEEQSLETKSKDHRMLETKSKVYSMSVKKTSEKNEQSLETNSKDHSRLETISKDHSISVTKTKKEEEQSLETISKDHSMSVKQTMDKKKQHLETKSKDHSMLETKSKDHSMSMKKIKEGNEHYSSLSEKGIASEMKGYQDVNFRHKANGSNKQVATVTPRRKECNYRDAEKTDLDIVDRETNGDTGVKTIHETRETTSYEMGQTLLKTVDGDISEILPSRKRPYTDASRYHVAMRPATPLLAKASPIPPVTLLAVKSTCLVQSDLTPAQCSESSKGALSQDELD